MILAFQLLISKGAARGAFPPHVALVQRYFLCGAEVLPFRMPAVMLPLRCCKLCKSRQLILWRVAFWSAPQACRLWCKFCETRGRRFGTRLSCSWGRSVLGRIPYNYYYVRFWGVARSVLPCSVADFAVYLSRSRANAFGTGFLSHCCMRWSKVEDGGCCTFPVLAWFVCLVVRVIAVPRCFSVRLCGTAV